LYYYFNINLLLQCLQLSQGYGDIKAWVRHSPGVRTGLSGVTLSGRTLRDDLFIVLYEGRLARLPRNATMGQFAIITHLNTELHGGWRWGVPVTVPQYNTLQWYSIILLSQTDWNDGRALCGIVRNLGGPASPFEKLETDPSVWEHNLQMGKTIRNWFPLFYL